MLYLFEFFTFTFPKAGVLVSGVPLTVAMLLFAFALLWSVKGIRPFADKFRGFAIVYVLYAVFILLPMVMSLSRLSLYMVSVSMVLILSPLAVIIGGRMEFDKTVRIISVALLIVGLYAVAQFLFGILATEIQGLNIAYGASFETKPIGFGHAEGGLDALKMPATYQNGNGAGLFYVLCLPLMFFWKPQKRRDTVLRILGVAGGLAGLFLCGSRSVLIPFTVIAVPSLLVYIKRRLPSRAQLLYVAGVILAICGVIAYFAIANSEFISYFIERYIVQTLSDPTGSGRTVLFQKFIDAVIGLDAWGSLRFIFFGMEWKDAQMTEGVVYILSYYGVFAFLSFLSILIYPLVSVFKKNKLLSVGLILMFIAFLIDTSFLYPPSLINYFFIAGLYMQQPEKIMRERAPRLDAADKMRVGA